MPLGAKHGGLAVPLSNAFWTGARKREKPSGQRRVIRRLSNCGEELVDGEAEVAKKIPVYAKWAAKGESIKKWKLAIESESRFIRKTREPNTAGKLVLWAVKMHMVRDYEVFLVCGLTKQSIVWSLTRPTACM